MVLIPKCLQTKYVDLGSVKAELGKYSYDVFKNYWKTKKNAIVLDNYIYFIGEKKRLGKGPT